jgi:hypothetical protein
MGGRFVSPPSPRSSGAGQISKHELRIDTDHTVAETAELPVTARVVAGLALAIAAIYFNDEADTRSEKINDEAASERHLDAKLHAKLTGFERRPKASFRLGEAGAMRCRRGRRAIVLATKKGVPSQSRNVSVHSQSLSRVAKASLHSARSSRSERARNLGRQEARSPKGEHWTVRGNPTHVTCRLPAQPSASRSRRARRGNPCVLQAGVSRARGLWRGFGPVYRKSSRGSREDSKEGQAIEPAALD